MLLRLQPARRCARRRPPRYPIAAAGALAMVAGCSPEPTPTPDTPTIVVTPDRATSDAPSSPTAEPGQGGPTRVEESRTPEQGAADAQKAPAFSVDGAPLDVGSQSCRGDCPSPFQMAASAKDRAQLQARLDWCVDASRRRGEVPVGSVVVRGTVGPKGDVGAFQLVSGELSLPADASECLRVLASRAQFTAPEGGGSRVLYAPVEVRPPK